MPAYNEEGSLRLVLSELRADSPPVRRRRRQRRLHRRTPAIAREMGYPVLDLCFNLGIGGAVQTGFKYAVDKGYDVAVQVDSDGQFPPDQIQMLVGLVLKRRLGHGHRLPLSSRQPGYDGSRSAPSRQPRPLRGSAPSSAARRSPTAHPASAPTAAAPWSTLLAYYPPTTRSRRSIVFLARQGLRIHEEPVDMRQRQAGASSIGGLKPLYYMSKVSLALTPEHVSKRNRRPETKGGEQSP